MQLFTILGIGLAIIIGWFILKALFYVGVIGAIGYGVFYIINKSKNKV
jgi:hypothetical protein